jgi:hypothetical protein
MASDVTVSGKVSDKLTTPVKAEVASPVSASPVPVAAAQPIEAPASMPVAPVVRVVQRDAEAKAPSPKVASMKGKASATKAPTPKSASAKLNRAAPGATKPVLSPKTEMPIAPKASVTKPAVSKPAAKAAQPADALRTIAEQSLTQARTAFAKSHEATETFAKGIETSREVVQAGVKEMQFRMAEALEAQTHAAFGFFRAMTKVHSFSEAIEVQSSAMRHGIQRTMGEAKEISSLAQAIASKATEPVRKAFDHAISAARPRH